MIKIIKYSLLDLLRSKWLYFYFFFFLSSTFALLLLNNDLNAAITNLMILTIYVSSLVSIIFGSMYFYNSREFILLLLAQPIKRSHILFGLYLSLNISLSLAYIGGVLILFVIYGIFISNLIFNFLLLIIAELFLTAIFTGIAMFISIYVDNKVKGFGYILFIWLLFTFIYDGIILLLLFFFSDYPLENFAIVTTLANPVDLLRILITIKLDSAMLMGYTGAIFSDFFGKSLGSIVSFLLLICWSVIPLYLSLRLFKRKDF